jgi:G3E family GTPase
LGGFYLRNDSYTAGFEPIPLTVITGFLGSGKTTLIKNLLSSTKMKNIAVIINEFGEIGLDHQLIESSNEDLVELSTGCLCCVMRGDLSEAIERLIKKRQEGWKLDRIILETTGLADPAPIIQALMVDKKSRSQVYLDRVLATVDVVTGLRSLSDFEECRRQVALADVLLLTKTDLSDENTNAVRNEIGKINSTATVSYSRLGTIDIDLIIDENNENILDNPRDLNSYHSHSHNEITSVALCLQKPIHAVTLTLFLEALAETLGANLIRLKGMVLLKEAPETPAVVHGVQHVFHPMSWRSDWPEGKKETRLVLIGKGLTLGWVEALIETIEEEVNAITK